MFREPTEAPKSSAVKDPSAAARSAIRRQASVRGRPGSRFRPSAYGAPYRSPFPRSIADEIEREVDGLGFRMRSPLSHSNAVDESASIIAALTDPARRVAGQRTLNDVDTHRHPDRHLRRPRDTELHDYRDRSASGEGSGGLQHAEFLPFTPRFAPAIAFHSTISAHPPPAYAVRSSASRLDIPGDDPGSHIPLLRRVGQRSVNEARRTNREPVVDGLGDRQRSLSPDDDPGHDAWETLLTTITPDTNLPSADSSFTSASVSATNGSRNRTSTHSFQTRPSTLDSAAPTMHMILDPYPEYLNPCDYPTTSDSDTELESDVTQLPFFREYQAQVQRAARFAQGSRSTADNHSPLPTASLTISDPPPYDDSERRLRILVEQFAQQENIPDSLWTAIGQPHLSDRGTGTNDQTPRDNPDGPGRQRL